MGLGHGASIVRSGLVLQLDAANKKSYPGTGTVWRDISNNGNNGALTNEPTYSSSDNGSFLFDNTNDLVIGPTSSTFVFSAAARNFTVEQWIKPNNLSGSFRAMSSVWGQGAGIDSWILCHSGGTLQFVWTPFSNVAHFIQGGTLSLNTWQHVAISRINNDFFLYLNSAQTATGSNSGIADATQRLEIAHYGAGTNYFSGNISETRIYNNYGLSSAEIRKNFEATRGRYGV